MSLAPVSLMLWCVAAQLVTAVLAVAIGRSPRASRAVYSLTLVISAVAFLAVLSQLVADAASISTVTLPLGLPWLGSLYRVDALASFFLVVVNLGGAAASFYALGYGRHEPAPERVLPFYAAFLAGMNLVVLADDAFTFLLSWEFMSLSSWALVMAHHREGENARAGYVYIVMASAGTLALLLAFGLLAGPTGHYAFAAIREAGAAPLSALVLILVTIGAGSKAGLIPLHVWLPLAHPAAPSHVSALMSGVMTKVAIYGFIRIAFDLLGAPEWWWSVLILTLGGLTAVMGVLYAMFQDDIKKLLAYSTIENIGVIFVGLGLALAFKTSGMATAAALAITAALFHVFNHSLFKSLLFFGAGALLTATGERRIEQMGGLIHRMPYTAFVFLVGCVAIAALPPLNGFVSEWLTFQAILLSPDLPQWSLKILVPAVGALLALSAALAAACFVRVYGIAFLSRPRSPAAAKAVEVDRLSLGAMFGLAGLCLLAGVLPGIVIDTLAPVATSLVGGRVPLQSAVAWLSIAPIGEGRSSYNGLLVFVFIAISASAGAVAIHRLASRKFRRGPAWDGGFPNADPATQYTAGSFAQPIRRVFGSIVFQANEHLEMPSPGSLAPARLTIRMRDLVWEWLYAPIAAGVSMAADYLNRFQFLTIRQYLSLVFVALIALLSLVALWP